MDPRPAMTTYSDVSERTRVRFNATILFSMHAAVSECTSIHANIHIQLHDPGRDRIKSVIIVAVTATNEYLSIATASGA